MIEALKEWVARKDFFMLLLVFLTVPIFAHAGGLGIAAIIGLCGLVALAGFPPRMSEIKNRFPMPVRMLLLLLVWGWISSFWSPYQSDDIMTNPVKLMLGVPVFLLCAYLIKMSASVPKKAKILTGILCVGTLALSVSILVDQLSGYAISFAVDPLDPGQDLTARIGDMIQNIGHATSVLTLLLAPVSVLLWTRGRIGKAASLTLVVLTLACGFTTGQSASTLGALTALLLMGLASRRPVLALRTGFLLAGASILFAPLLAFLSAHLGANIKNALPFSWEERVENWSYLSQKLSQHPIVGHGFDAVRMFNDTHTIRGFEGRALVSLHPHNAGLHIWVELGVIGAVLSCTALYFALRYLSVPNRLSKTQMVATSGLLIAVVTMSSLSYGVWQDWWWASIIFAGAQVFFINKPKPILYQNL